ncbi:MAG: glycosyltransferase family 39 protein, partial [Acidobacteriota bacterium]|nr:glycosyltransferase family 39 protein [Acidobacteriota bacterium]
MAMRRNKAAAESKQAYSPSSGASKNSRQKKARELGSDHPDAGVAPIRLDAKMKWVSPLILTLLVLACLTPFLGKAFHIDDPLFVWAGKQIARHPGNPYGFIVTWYTEPQQMSDVTQNPPLAAYYIAIAGEILGWSEAALHGAFLLPALAVVLGTYFLARRFTRWPLLAGAATLAAPGFLVSSTTVMCDVTMLALWIFATLFWLEGMERRRPPLLAVSGLLIALCALTKYFGVALIPLLLLYSLARERRVGSWVFYLLLPVAALVGYEYWTKALYGRGLLGGAADYAQSNNSVGFYKAVVGLSFAGGCTLPALTFAPLVWSRRALFLGGAAAAILGLLVRMDGLNMPSSIAPDHRNVLSLQLALFIASGLGALALAFADGRRNRDANSILLLLWVVGTWVFASFVNWTVNARSVLPMIPAVAILLARRLETLGAFAGKLRMAKLVVPLALSAAVALWVTWADASLANSARQAAQYVHDRLSKPAINVSFEGHWGFQYYMQAYGLQPVNFRDFHVGNGDVVVIPSNS